MKNTDTNKNEEAEFHQVQSARSPGEQPMSEDKEIITKKEVRIRLIITVVVILAIIIGIILALQ
ncbi:MAG: hypothetical protein ACOCV1_02870 [Bacillota bacterium]